MYTGSNFKKADRRFSRGSSAGKGFFRFAAFGAVIFFLAGCATLGGRPADPVTVDEVIDMSRTGVPPQEIIQKMKETETVYRLEASRLADLKDKGVSDQVIDYMQETHIEAVRSEQISDNWYGGNYGWYWPHRPYWPYIPYY